jgi:Domain of unknown function (DUF4112)
MQQRLPERQLALSRFLARNLDSRWRLGPMRFGLESIFRFIPVVGGSTSAVVSLYQMALAARLRMPPSKLARMGAYAGVDLVFGLVPYVGDLADAFFRAHMRNQRLIDRHVEARGLLAAPSSDPSKPGTPPAPQHSG